jgi:hypothetical protein
VGGVSERAGVEAGGSDPSAKCSSTRRDGRRHPGRPEIVALRGAAVERRPRSVRRRQRVPLASTARRRQRMSEGRRGGERRRAYALQSVCTGAGTRDRRMRSGRRVLRSVLRPVRVDPHYARDAKSVFVVGRPLRHHGWANPRKWEEPTLGLDVSGAARLAACHRSRKGEGVARQKRKEVEAFVPARIQSPGWCSHVVSVAEVCRRPLVSNKLGIRAPKRAVRVE